MVSGRDLALFTRHLYYLTRSETPIPDILRNLRWDIQNRELRHAVGMIEEKTRRGEAFSSALHSYPHIFPEYYFEMVRSAEEADNLPQVLEDLAQYVEEAERAKRNARAAALYPVLVMNFIFLFLLAFYLLALPIILNTLHNVYGGMAPQAASMIPTIAQLIFNPFFLALFLMVVVLADIIIFTNTRIGNSFLFHFPLINKLIATAYLVRISRTLGFMLKKSMPMPQALEQTIKTIDVKAIQDILIRVKREVEEGLPLSAALKEESLFTDAFISMVKTGESKEDLPLALLDTANIYEKELEWRTAGALKAIEPLLICVIGALLGLILASVFYLIYLIPSNIS